VTFRGSAGVTRDVERVASLLTVALSDGRRRAALLDAGPNRAFQTDLVRITVPVPMAAAGDPSATLACGIALQCSPTKEEAVQLQWWALPRRQRRALGWMEGEAAARWVAQRWPGLAGQIRRHFPWVGTGPIGIDADALSTRRSECDAKRPAELPALFGVLPPPVTGRGVRRGRKTSVSTPWTTREQNPRAFPDSIPVNGEGGEDVASPALADDLDALDGQRRRLLGTPYDEWDAHRRVYRRDYVRVVELTGRAPGRPGPRRRVPAITPSRARERHQEDGDVDTDAVVAWHCDAAAGWAAPDARLFTGLVPVGCPAVWCLLVDGSASSSAGGGEVFRRALAGADAAAAALVGQRQRVGVFTFRSFSHERVEVRTLKGYDEPYSPLGPGPTLRPDGYTRLGAALRHTGRRLRQHAGAGHVLVSLGDGLASDEGYDGAYARADVAKAVDEQRRAGTLVVHGAVTTGAAGPLDEMFGPGGWVPATAPGDIVPLLARVARDLGRRM
jgi:nitric oxide reductase NorD protein